jgi:DNA-binding SARP family transcriptional activator
MSGTTPTPSRRYPGRRAAQLQRATDLYQSDLDLEGLESEALVARREQLRQQALAALLELGGLHLAAGALAAAAAYRRAVALDGYLEPAHRGLMRALVAQGAQGAALAHYQSLAARLQHELGLAPDEETQAMAESIRQASAPGPS